MKRIAISLLATALSINILTISIAFANPQAILSWAVTQDGVSGGLAMAVDASANVYLAGMYGSDWIIVKDDIDGTKQWECFISPADILPMWVGV